MVTTSFVIRPETRFDECTIKPAKIGELEKFPSDLSKVIERQSLDRQWFKGGLSCCPYCTADLFEQMGDSRGYALFRDQSLLSQVDTQGFGDRCEEAAEILSRTRLISDGSFDPRIDTRFTVSSAQSNSSSLRCPTYRHLPGHGGKCRADTEHEAVIRLIRSRWTTVLEQEYPGCDVSSTLNLKATKDVNRRPDLFFKIEGDSSHGPVSFSFAVEVQQSKIGGFNNWLIRDQDLRQVADKCLWMFKKGKATGEFRPPLKYLMEHGHPSLLYEISGEPGSNDGVLTLITPQKYFGEIGFKHLHQTQSSLKGFTIGSTQDKPADKKTCQNSDQRHAKEVLERYRVKVSERSSVECPDLIKLCGFPSGGTVPTESVSAVEVDPLEPATQPESVNLVGPKLVGGRINARNNKIGTPGVKGVISMTPLYFPKKPGQDALFVANLEVSQFLCAGPNTGRLSRNELFAELFPKELLLRHSQYLESDEIVVKLKIYGSLADIAGAHISEGWRVWAWGRLGWDRRNPGRLCIEPTESRIAVISPEKGAFGRPLSCLARSSVSQPN